jgi:hypothetical protein
MDKPHTHHDALEFPGGRSVLVTHLSKGQHVTVLQLPASPRVEKTVEERANAAEERSRISFVA